MRWSNFGPDAGFLFGKLKLTIVFFGDGSGVCNANTIPLCETGIAPSLKGCVQLFEIFGLDPNLATFFIGIRSFKALVW